jgi:hypothetical protein
MYGTTLFADNVSGLQIFRLLVIVTLRDNYTNAQIKIVMHVSVITRTHLKTGGKIRPLLY